MGMKVLIVGGGGREHAIATCVAKSPKVDKIYCAPGNAGIGQIAECVPIGAMEFDKIVAFAKEQAVDLTIVGMDDPLVGGLVDALEAEGLRAFGPRKNAAILEGSKAFSKDLMKKYNIPTAAYENFDNAEDAIKYLKEQASFPIVLKADGLALGKGVLICNTLEEALAGVDEIMLDKKFGAAGNRMVIEEFMTGREVSVLSFVDGKTIRIYCNIGSPEDVHAVQVNDGGGIGLFRSEFLYLNSPDYPTEDQQFEAYKKVLADMDGKEVIIRTLDIGADKQIGYFDLPKEDNPAMGMRALRICLTRPEIFKTQLRALFRASAFGKLGIMFPMVTSVWEVREAKRMCEEVRRELKNEGVPYSEDVQIGIMIETPAAAINSDRLAKEVDFFSIGTNDLTQYTLACDRQNNDLGRFYDPHHPAVLRLIRLVTENAHKNGIWVGICGELGADLTLTETFLAFGVDELSVTPRSVLPLRNAVRMTDTRESSERILSDLDSDYTAR